MERYEIPRHYQRGRVFMFILFVTIPLVCIVIYFDCLVSLLIIEEHAFHGIGSVLEQPLWRLILLALVQYCANTIIISYFLGLGKVLLRNRQFLFGSGAE